MTRAKGTQGACYAVLVQHHAVSATAHTATHTHWVPLRLCVCVPHATTTSHTHRLGFNFSSAGSSVSAPPLPAAAQEDGWWNIDHERVKVCGGALAVTKPLCAHSPVAWFRLHSDNIC